MIQIDPEKIGAIIGPGGRVIKEIISQTGTQIDIADDDSGSIMVYSKDVNSAKDAVKWIKVLAGDIEVGSVFQGIVRRIVDFGIFVELVPGKDGLVHISSIAKDKQRDIEKRCKIGSVLKVKVTRFDSQTGRINLEAPELK
jgi:polyribonucleotide nucleotidyltransferase